MLKKFLRAATVLFAFLLATACVNDQSGKSGTQERPRKLRVVLYPFIPNFETAAEYIKLHYEAENPQVSLEIIDLRGNYYDSTDVNYVGNVSADIFELDSVLLRDFVTDGKIREMPSEALLPSNELLSNADRGTRLDGKRYGAAHWVCRNFLFYSTDDAPSAPVRTLSDLENFIGAKSGLIIDLRGKSTLGEYYLMAALDRYPDWKKVYPDKITTIDLDIETDVLTLSKHCDNSSCRNKVLHDYTGTHGAEFARRKGKALVGYSESLHDVLAEVALCSSADSCLTPGKIAVAEFPLDNNGSKPMSWVDSFTLSTTCQGNCTNDAVRFVSMMNRDDTYLALLFPGSLSFLTVDKPYPPVPAYLLPAKTSLYSRPDVLKSAPLYPTLRKLTENADVPTDRHLNDGLRQIGKQIDKDLDK